MVLSSRDAPQTKSAFLLAVPISISPSLTSFFGSPLAREPFWCLKTSRAAVSAEG